MIDVDHQINAVRRAVGTRVLEAGEARTVTISQVYDPTVDDVWDACTNPERIPRWFLPVVGDLRVGGSYQLEGNASGTIERCDPPSSFFATWEYGGEVSWIEVRLAAEGGGTRLRDRAHRPRRRHALGASSGPAPSASAGTSALMGLALHLSSGADNDPAAFAAWMASDDGRRFMTLSSEGWRDASVAAGTDEAAARAAAERTTAAYTGAPELTPQDAAAGPKLAPARRCGPRPGCGGKRRPCWTFPAAPPRRHREPAVAAGGVEPV